MLKTNSKAVMEAVTRDALEYFEEDAAALLEDMEAAGRPLDSDYMKAGRMVEGGFFRVYYEDVRAFLREALKESEEEAARYTDEECWSLYKHLTARALCKLKKSVNK